MRKIFTLMLSLLALCLQVAAQTAQPDPDVLIKFKGATGTSDQSVSDFANFKTKIVESGADYLSGISDINQVYASKSNGGLKLGVNKQTGTVTLNLATDYQKIVDKVVINAARYNSTGAPTLLLNDIASSEGLSSNTSYADMTFTGFSETEPVKSLKLSTGTNVGAVNIRSISIYFKREVAAEKPSKPVVMVDGTETAEEDVKADYGAMVSVSAENATSMIVAYGNEEVPVDGNTYEFEATANETYMVTPFNNMMPEGEQEGEAAMFAIAINAPEILSVMNGEEAIEEFGSIVAREGTEIAVSAKSYADIAVDNDGVTVTVTDGKFVIGNEGSYIITVSNPACGEKAEMMFEVTHPEETVYEVNETLDWDITGVANANAAGKECNTKLNLGTGSANGDWTAAAAECYSGSNNGAQLGSGAKAFVDGTLTLSGSDIPENATIAAVSMKGIPGNTPMEWTLSVNGVDADKKLSFPANGTSYGKDKHSTKTISDLSLTGNKIVLTMTSAGDKKAFYLSGISVSYYVLAEPSAPEFDKPATIEHGTEIVYTVKYGKIHYHIEDADAAKNPMARASEPTADWTVATEDGGKKFTYTFASGNNHNIYVKNVVNGKEVMGEAINVKEGVVTGVESVAAEGAEGVRELYNLQGVRVSEAEAVPGVYVERRGGKVAKVVIR